MHIEANKTYTMLMSARGAQAAPSGTEDNDETTHKASTAATGKAEEPANNAVSGTTGSRLSAEMDRTLIGQQETGTSNTDTDDYDGPLSLAVRHGLEDIANNPEYAATQARTIGIFGEFVWVGKVLPTENNGFTAAERNAFMARQNRQMAGMEQMQGKRTAYYENLAEQGLPPAEIFAKMLEFNANLPESYDDTLGWSKSGRANGMSYSDFQKAQLDYLQNLLDQAGTKHSDAA
jgi:hypothetical protein